MDVYSTSSHLLGPYLNYSDHRIGVIEFACYHGLAQLESKDLGAVFGPQVNASWVRLQKFHYTPSIDAQLVYLRDGLVVEEYFQRWTSCDPVGNSDRGR